jgi:hypothetical protein
LRHRWDKCEPRSLQRSQLFFASCERPLSPFSPDQRVIANKALRKAVRLPGGFSSRIAALARRPSGSVADFSDIGVHTCLCLRFIRRRMGKEGDSWPNSDKKPSWLFLRAPGRNDRAFFRSPRGGHRSSGRRGIFWDRPMHGRNRCAQPRFAHKKRGEEVLSETSDLGPDFIAGVTMAEIPDGGVKAGHVGGKSARSLVAAMKSSLSEPLAATWGGRFIRD